MKSRLNICPRCRKTVKSISSLTKYVNACKILVILPSRLFLKLEQALKYNNTSNLLDVPSNNNKENLELANKDKQKSATLSDFML